MALSTFPTSARRAISQVGVRRGFRTFWAFLFVSRANVIGALIARRTEVRAFTPAQIKLLETFADQAVIAIENVRLFNELKGIRTLEQQTATSEILGVIASSPTDIQPVLDASCRKRGTVCAMRLSVVIACTTVNDFILSRSHFGPQTSRRHCGNRIRWQRGLSRAHH